MTLIGRQQERASGASTVNYCMGLFSVFSLCFFLPDRVDLWKCRNSFHTTVQSHIDGSQLAERKQTSNTEQDAHVGTVLQMLLIWRRHACRTS